MLTRVHHGTSGLRTSGLSGLGWVLSVVRGESRGVRFATSVRRACVGHTVRRSGRYGVRVALGVMHKAP